MGEVIIAAAIGAAATAGTAAYSQNRSRAARRDMKEEQQKRDLRQTALERELASRQKVNEEGLQMQDARRRQQMASLAGQGNAGADLAGGSEAAGSKTLLGS